jgi:histidine triad (HIT) family protein
MHREQGHAHMNEECVFCAIAALELDGSSAMRHRKTITFLDLRQPYQGHLLVMPRDHFKEVREMDDATIEAVILAIQRAAQAIDLEFAGDGVSVRHSSKQRPCCDITHAHFHVRPRHVARLHPADIGMSFIGL